MKKLFLFLLAIISIATSRAYEGETIKLDNYKVTILSEENHEVSIGGLDDVKGGIVLPSCLTINAEEYTVVEIMDNGFSHNRSMTSVTIPGTVTRIGDYAFDGCSSLSYVDIPSSVTSIGIYAFSECTALAAITIPDSVTSLSEGIFFCCTGLKSVIIPESVTSIGDRAFNACGFTSINLPGSVTTIGDCSFRGCDLAELSLPSSVTSIATYAFSSCSRLSSVDIHCSLGTYTFHGCENLKWVTIHDTATSIGYGSFAYCREIESLDLPRSIKTISDRAFTNCTGLKKITIPDSVKRIETETFSDCTGLKKIIIPESVNWIECGAFYNCTSLETIIDLRPEPPVVNFGGYYPCFGNVPKTLTIYVPEGSAPAYATANEWNQFSDFREMEGSVSITLDRTDMTLKVGERTKFSATVMIDGEVVSGRAGWWTSSHPGVVYCDIDGNAVAITEGTTTMTFTVSDKYGVRHQADCKVTVSGEAGISGISADTPAPTEIYNLRGIRVSDDPAALSPGLYILCQGSSTRKILVK